MCECVECSVCVCRVLCVVCCECCVYVCRVLCVVCVYVECCV